MYGSLILRIEFVLAILLIDNRADAVPQKKKIDTMTNSKTNKERKERKLIEKGGGKLSRSSRHAA